MSRRLPLRLSPTGSPRSSIPERIAASASFIRIVAPKIAVMMHDKLASPQVYRRYRKVGAAVFLTALDGCVRVASGADGDAHPVRPTGKFPGLNVRRGPAYRSFHFEEFMLRMNH
jgi:hypothetical protein